MIVIILFFERLDVFPDLWQQVNFNVSGNLMFHFLKEKLEYPAYNIMFRESFGVYTREP